MRIQCPFSKAKIQINPQFFRLSFTWHWNLYPRYAFSPFWENFQLSWIVRAIRARVRLLSIKQATSINSRFLKYLFKVQQDNLDLEYGLFAPFSFKVVQNFIFSLFFSNFFAFSVFLSFLDQSTSRWLKSQPERSLISAT